ncbi:hypothetical protein BDV06DRAFT_205107 [Aspergillus oleicola]
MSLKRKASFPSIASPQSPQSAIDRSLQFMDDCPRHLHSRTRKRVRNDRPDDQAVYDKTLRWLFTAQQRVQQIPTPPAEPESDRDENEDMNPEPTPVVDHRQQSLLQFFHPAATQPSRQTCSSTPMSQFENIQGGNDSSHGHGHSVGIVPPATPSNGMTMAVAITPAPELADRDMDGDEDMDMGL